METPNSKRSFRLIFVLDKAEAEAHSGTDVVFVWPASDGWNDQGYRLLIDFLIRADEKEHRPERPAAMVFNRFKDSHEAIAFMARSPTEASASGLTFASLQMEVNEYRRIGRTFLPGTALSVLEAMHDLAVEENKVSPAPWLEEVKRLEAFSIGMLRPASRYFAYRRGYDFLVGNEAEAIRQSEAATALSFKLDAFTGSHLIALNFGKSAEVSRRIHVLIGRNGVGKSQTLSRLVTALAHPNSRKARLHPQGVFNRVIAFSGVAAQSSLPSKSPAPRNLQYHFYNLSPGHGRGKRHPLTAALVDIVRSEDYLNDIRRIDVFAGAIRGWMALEQIYLPLKDAHLDQDTPWRQSVLHSGVRYASVNEALNLGEMRQLKGLGGVDLSKPPRFAFSQKLTPLSSGQELYFRFALHLCASIDVGTLVLIDEPENHLHPNFVTELMALLRDILAQTGSFALIASHSPFVVREVTHHDVSIMDRSAEGAPSVRQPRLRTLGASVAAVSLYVFGDDTLATLARLTLESQDVPQDAWDEAQFERLSQEYSNEAVSHIRSVLLERQAQNTRGTP
jgi:ABC-type transport system involved in cytochrome c biogenesis ATPase subunit